MTGWPRYSAGVFEMEKFSKGTFAIAKTLAEITEKGEIDSCDTASLNIQTSCRLSWLFRR